MRNWQSLFADMLRASHSLGQVELHLSLPETSCAGNGIDHGAASVGAAGNVSASDAGHNGSSSLTPFALGPCCSLSAPLPRDLLDCCKRRPGCGNSATPKDIGRPACAVSETSAASAVIARRVIKIVRRLFRLHMICQPLSSLRVSGSSVAQCCWVASQAPGSTRIQDTA